MPKINIDAASSGGNRVEVTWAKDRDVQIATVATAPNVTLCGLPDGATSTFSGLTPGLFVDLDRAGINRLIRGLRDARDQAFGRDE